MLVLLLLLSSSSSNGRSWIYSINLLASQYSFANSLRVMVQFWALKEVIFVHCCVLQFAYCAVPMAEDFDVMEVCCETVVTHVEPEICKCLFSGLIFVVFPCGFDVLPLCLAGWGSDFLGEFFLCLFLYKSLNCFKVGWSLFVLKCGAFFLPIGQLFHFHVFLHVRGPTERLLSCPVCWGVLLFFLCNNLSENYINVAHVHSIP